MSARSPGRRGSSHAGSGEAAVLRDFRLLRSDRRSGDASEQELAELGGAAFGILHRLLEPLGRAMHAAAARAAGEVTGELGFLLQRPDPGPEGGLEALG